MPRPRGIRQRTPLLAQGHSIRHTGVGTSAQLNQWGVRHGSLSASFASSLNPPRVSRFLRGGSSVSCPAELVHGLVWRRGPTCHANMQGPTASQAFG